MTWLSGKTLGGVLLAAIGLDWTVLLLARAGLLPLPGGLAFILIVGLLILPSLFWWNWTDRRLLLASGRATRAAWALYMAVMLLPIGLGLMGGRHLWDALPVPLTMWVMLWYLTVLALTSLALGPGVVCFVVFLGGKLFSRKTGTSDSSSDSGKPPGQDPAGTHDPVRDLGDTTAITRRAALGHLAAAGPLLIVGGGVGLGIQQDSRFIVRRVRLSLPRCPDRLRGLTITHLSDLHVGRFFQPKHLPAMVEAVNRLNSDLVVVTGDVLDHSMDFLYPSAEAIRRLEHRYGRFLVAGNHDLIDSPSGFVSEMTRRERGFLLDEHVTVDIGGEKLLIAGLFWSRGNESHGLAVGHDERAGRSLSGTDPAMFKIALAHHPHAFDALASRGVDLTLAGHTHGGQFSLPIPGTSKAINAGSLMFRYIHGEYRKGASRLWVTAGVGNWFPVRLNAPAEIVQLQLV
ncbi:MAG TPA: metallophosphoesterase [Phycisphaerae bacterium]|nr:metallophosphoesterase [Phycisphaerae bacterium]